MAKAINIVVVGGGMGVFTVLFGLKSIRFTLLGTTGIERKHKENKTRRDHQL